MSCAGTASSAIWLLDMMCLLQIEQVGQGTFGTVFRAMETSADSLPDVAIKLLPRGATVRDCSNRTQTCAGYALLSQSAFQPGLHIFECHPDIVSAVYGGRIALCVGAVPAVIVISAGLCSACAARVCAG